MALPGETGILGQKTVSMLRPPQIPHMVDWGGPRAPVAHHTSLPTETDFNVECNSFFSSAYFANPAVTHIHLDYINTVYRKSIFQLFSS